MESMDYFIKLAGKNLHPGDLDEFNSKKDHLVDVMKQQAYFNTELLERYLAAEAREAIFKAVALEYQERMETITGTNFWIIFPFQ